MRLKRRSEFPVAFLLLTVLLSANIADGHEAKDFDDSLLYKIDFEVPNFDNNPELKNQLKTFYTHDLEQYDCVIPIVAEPKEQPKSTEAELSPFTLLQPIFTTPSCSYRIEAYWSYEICHGHHVRQYHEEREGKTVKFQEYYLGKWNEDKSVALVKSWEEERKTGMKYKTTKIENTKYPYFEVQMADGTMCDIINEPRTTVVRYVCYPHGKNEIYSFKETSSCNYEAIILTSALCMIPAFHPEESKEVSIKCFNSLTEPHKPLSLLRQELGELSSYKNDFPVSKEASSSAIDLANAAMSGDRYMFLNKYGGDVDKLVLELMSTAGVYVEAEIESGSKAALPRDTLPLREFLSGKNCLEGGTGWWKYEFCYGRHVRQFHKDQKTETELVLGYFSKTAHRRWVSQNPEKGAKRPGHATSVWHHYEQGTLCDRTNLPREVDVKLTCTPYISGTEAMSMYLLEPKTCQYILVVESPLLCDIIAITDQYGMVQEDELQKLFTQGNLQVEATEEPTSGIDGGDESRATNLDATGATDTVAVRQDDEIIRV